MSKLIAMFLILGIAFSIISGWMEGAGGIQAVELNSNLSTTATTITVTDTSGFLNADVLSIDDEYVSYSGKNATQFLNVARGIWSTSATTHQSGAYVYTEGAAAVNKAMGFNVAAIGVSNGLYTVATLPFRFFTVTLPYLIFNNFSMFEGQMVYFRYVLLALGLSFYVVLAISLDQVVGYSLRR